MTAGENVICQIMFLLLHSLMIQGYHNEVHRFYRTQSCSLDNTVFIIQLYTTVLEISQTNSLIFPATFLAFRIIISQTSRRPLHRIPFDIMGQNLYYRLPSSLINLLATSVSPVVLLSPPSPTEFEAITTKT